MKLPIHDGKKQKIQILTKKGLIMERNALVMSWHILLGNDFSTAEYGGKTYFYYGKNEKGSIYSRRKE